MTISLVASVSNPTSSNSNLALAKKLAAVSILPNGYTLECSINGGAPFACTAGQRIPADRFDMNIVNTLSIVVVNSTVPGQIRRSTPTTISISFAKDSPTETLVPTLSGVTSDSLTCQTNIKDTDGITDLKCVFQANDGKIYQPTSTEGSMFKFTGLPANTQGFIVSSANAVIKLPNGSTKLQSVETRTQAATLPKPVDTAEVFTAPTITVGITSVTIGADGSVTDPDNAKLQYTPVLSYEVRDLSGKIFSPTVLQANTDYEVYVKYSTYNGETGLLVAKTVKVKAIKTLPAPVVNTILTDIVFQGPNPETNIEADFRATIANLLCQAGSALDNCTLTIDEAKSSPGIFEIYNGKILIFK